MRFFIIKYLLKAGFTAKLSDTDLSKDARSNVDQIIVDACEKMDADVQTIMESTLLSCRMHIKNILTMKWNIIREYVDERILGKKKSSFYINYNMAAYK